MTLDEISTLFHQKADPEDITDAILGSTEFWQLYEESTLCELETPIVDEFKISDHSKKKTNRLFREQVGYTHAYYPEVDNKYEQIRSYLIRKLLVFKNNISKMCHALKKPK